MKWIFSKYGLIFVIFYLIYAYFDSRTGCGSVGCVPLFVFPSFILNRFFESLFYMSMSTGLIVMLNAIFYYCFGAVGEYASKNAKKVK
jgi:hypothetical protein